MLVAKLDSKFYRIVKFAVTVKFSSDVNWLLLERNIHLPGPARSLVWVKSDTRFTWIRQYSFE
jgi:hypothetical protein